MPLEKIFRDVFGDDGLVLLQGGIIMFALLRGDLEADIQQLAERRVLLVVAQPSVNCLEFQPFMMDDGGNFFLSISITLA